MKGRETTHAERVEIVERHQAGETLDAIAESLLGGKCTLCVTVQASD